MDPLYVTEANLQEAIAYLPNPTYRKRIKTSEDIIADRSDSLRLKSIKSSNAGPDGKVEQAPRLHRR